MNTRILTRTALFAALTAAGAFIRIPLGYSPSRCSSSAPPWPGACWAPPAAPAQSGRSYVALGLLGRLSSRRAAGLSYLLQPTCGFLLGLLPSAWVIGLLTARRPPHPRGRRWLASWASPCCTPWAALLAVILNRYMGKAHGLSPPSLWAGMLPFLPGDMLKIAVTAALAPLLQKRLSAAQ